jgi:hypothetical protein
MITKFDKKFMKNSVKIYAVAVVLVVGLFILKSIFLDTKEIKKEEFKMNQKAEILHVETEKVESNETEKPKILLFK